MKASTPAYTIDKPQRSPSIGPDVGVPFLQAAVTGLLFSTAVVTIAWGVWNVDYWPTWPIVMAPSLAVAWLWRLVAVRETLFITESVLGRDLDGDGVVGKPKTRVVTIQGPQPKPEPPQEDIAAEFIQFIQGCEHDTAMRQWEQVIGRDQYQKWRDALIQLGWAEWLSDDRRQGWRLVWSAEEIIKGVGYWT